MPLYRKQIVTESSGLTIPSTTKTTANNNDFFIGIDENSELYKIKKSNLLAGLSSGSTTPPSNVENVVLLLPFDGDFTDIKGNLVTGNAIISTRSKYGNGSVYFNQSTFLDIASNNTFNLGSTPLTIEFWIYPELDSGQQTLIERRAPAFNPGDWIIWYAATGNNKISIVARDNDGIGNDFLFTNSGDVLANVWSHIAIIRSLNIWSIYVNGIKRGEANKTFSFTDNIQSITLGKDNGGGGRFYFKGNLDDLRITKAALYNGDFTPPQKLPITGS